MLFDVYKIYILHYSNLYTYVGKGNCVSSIIYLGSGGFQKSTGTQ